jgi:hypothetical protein
LRGRADRVDRHLHVAVGAVLDADPHRQARGERAVDLALHRACADRAPAHEVGVVLAERGVLHDVWEETRSVAKVTIFVGTFVAIAGFGLDFVGYGDQGAMVFVLGIVVALFGVALTIAPSNLGDDKTKNVIYRASVAGFIIAAVSTMLNAYIQESRWFTLAFQAGALLFVFGIILLLAISLLRAVRGR